MTPDTTTSKHCPTCGTRVSDDVTKCLVCGADLGNSEKPAQATKDVQGSRMPSVTLSLPAAIGLLALFLVIGAILVYFALRQTPEAIIPPMDTATATSTATSTATNTPTPPPTTTYTPEPSPTPITYQVKENDTCIAIALFYGVSVESIVTLNNLPVACDSLYIDQPLLIPQPTPTTTPLPSATLSLAEQTEAACEKVVHVVQSTDTLSAIAATYDVPMLAIREENGMTSDSVFLGQSLTIPLCRRYATPGPTPTATPPPPYPASNLLLPANGAAFAADVGSISLQWASVGTLRDNEAYAVTIEDITTGKGITLVQYVTDTRFIIPATIRPNDDIPHIFSWVISVVRQEGSDEEGNPIWISAGTMSSPRYFSWIGTISTTPSP
jgi:LysM repeat protein